MKRGARATGSRARGRAPPRCSSGTRGARWCGVDRLARERATTRRCSTASTLLVKSPGVPGEAAARPRARGAGIPVWTEVELGYRLLAARDARRRHRHERQDDDDRAARRDLRAAGRAVAVAGNVGTRRSTGVERAADWVVCELSSFQLEDVHELALRRRRAAQPRARPPRPARHRSRPTAPRSCGSSSAARRRHRDRRRAGFAAVPGEGGASSSRADDPLPAEPLHPRARTTARTPPPRPPRRGGRDRRRGDRRGARDVPRRRAPARARRASSAACATSTTRRRRTSRRRCRALAAYADEPVHLILGGSLQGRGLRAARRRDRPERARRLPDRRGRGRARRALAPAGVERDGDARARRRRAPRRARAGRRRAALARLRELRPVRRLRAARRGVPAARGRTLGAQ